jgi:hypothetical protein
MGRLEVSADAEIIAKGCNADGINQHGNVDIQFFGFGFFINFNFIENKACNNTSDNNENNNDDDFSFHDLLI